MYRAIHCLLVLAAVAAGERFAAGAARPSQDALKFVAIGERDVASTLANFAAQMTSNYQSIRTWKGTYQFHDIHLIEGDVAKLLRDGIDGESDSDPSSLVKTETCNGEFAIDFESDSLFTTIRRDGPTQFVDRETREQAGPRKYQPGLYERNIVTPEHYLQLEPNEIYGRLRVHRDWAVKHGPVAFRNPAADGQNDQYGQVVDPRRFMWYKAPFGEYFGHWARLLEQPKTGKDVRKMFKLAKAQIENRLMVRLRVEDREEYLFDSSVGFNPIFSSRKPGKGIPLRERKYEYRETDGVYVVSRLLMTIFADDGKTISFKRDWTLGECTLNGPIDPATFTYANLGLQDGNRVVDKIENVGYIYRDGKLTDPVRFREIPRRPHPGQRTPIEDVEPVPQQWLIIANVAVVVLVIAVLVFVRVRSKRT